MLIILMYLLQLPNQTSETKLHPISERKKKKMSSHPLILVDGYRNSE